MQRDVLDHPFKKMLYSCTHAIERLFEDANKYDNPLVQTRALILLCRMPVPMSYLKSFQKGLDVLIKNCFDEQGNFIGAAYLGDIRFIFKDYDRKTPASWQQIAKLSARWCKNSKPYGLYTPYYAFTCTQHNEELLAIVKSVLANDKAYAQYLVHKNGSKIAYQMYEYYLFTQLK